MFLRPIHISNIMEYDADLDNSTKQTSNDILCYILMKQRYSKLLMKVGVPLSRVKLRNFFKEIKICTNNRHKETSRITYTYLRFKFRSASGSNNTFTKGFDTILLIS